MRSKSRKVTRKEVEQMKVDKFKEYMNSDRFPYKLLLANFEGRCAVCFKFLKGTVSRSESEIYCVGCPLASGSEPISWQAKPADLVVYVMWKDTLRLKKDVIFNHSSYLNLLGSKHKGNETIESCMAYTAEKHTEDYELPCCNEIAPKSYSSVAIAAGDLLPIYLERIV